MKQTRNQMSDFVTFMDYESKDTTKKAIKAKREVRRLVRRHMNKEDKVGFTALLFVLFGIWLTVALLARFAPDVFRAW